ncbi:MAG: cytochrome P450 [Acidimicrobiales bacterium]|nr:cytochrome P450 [Acidimicrobiales bacterium]
MAEPLYYDPFDFDVDRRAHDVWRRMRDEAPLYRNEKHDFYALTRYDDVLTCLLDADTYVSRFGTTLDLMSDQVFPMPMFIFRDPPEHTLLRKLVSRAFTPRKIDGLEARIERVCARLLDPLEGLSTFDFVQTFSSLVPPTVILALLGFPEGLETEMRASVDNTMAIDENVSTGSRAVIEGENIGSVVYELIPDLCRQRRAEPQDDLITVLATHERELLDGTTRPLTDEEIMGYVALIAGAGSETVARMLGWAVVLLADHPEQLAMLGEDEARIPNAVEEILRYEAPSPVQGRRTMRDVEFHGETVPAGSNLLLVNGSGNRDERHFADADRFDITRDIDRHLSFGYGAHFCIGGALARLEGRVGLEQMVRRFGAWDVDHDALEWVHTSTVRGYKSVTLHL